MTSRPLTREERQLVTRLRIACPTPRCRRKPTRIVVQPVRARQGSIRAWVEVKVCGRCAGPTKGGHADA